MAIGGTTQEQALARLSDMTAGIEGITPTEHAARIEKAQAFMREQGIAALYLNAGTNLAYFTGMRWNPSERMVGAILPASGSVEYIAPAFEEGTLHGFMKIPGPVNCWHEHENAYALFVSVLRRMGIPAGSRIGLDESTPFFIADGIRLQDSGYVLENAKPVTAHCRMRKSAAEIALMQRAKDMTMEVHKEAASILREGITTAEVTAFIDRAHRQVGASGSYFCIVLFGEASAYPHGVNYEQELKQGDPPQNVSRL